MKGRQNGGIALQLERQAAKDAHCSIGVLQHSDAKGSTFRHESTGVLGVGEIFQPIVKGHQTGMDAQDRNQFLIDTIQALRLSADQVELPKDNGIRC